jgi:hypothetical protein
MNAIIEERLVTTRRNPSSQERKTLLASSLDTIVEFPARIRYTSLSLPYHIGTGWFGGLLPTTAFSLVGYSRDIYFGLRYAVLALAVCVIVGALGLRESKSVHIAD